MKEMSSFMRQRRLQGHGHVCQREEDEDIRQVTNRKTPAAMERFCEI